MNSIFDFFMNLDSHLFNMIIDYGPWIYGILFTVIFIETGFVVLPFLPGDSLLFASGTFCAGVQNEAGDLAQLNLWIILLSLSIAAVLGDSLNYYLGKSFGSKVITWKMGERKLVNPNHVDRTKRFFKKHGSKTIIIARFIPIVRTFAPFVAGIGDMHYIKFIRFNVIGGGLWVLVITLAGYFFGNLPFVKSNFEYVLLGIIALSLIPVILQLFRKIQKN